MITRMRRRRNNKSYNEEAEEARELLTPETGIFVSDCWSDAASRSAASFSGSGTRLPDHTHSCCCFQCRTNAQWASSSSWRQGRANSSPALPACPSTRRSDMLPLAAASNAASASESTCGKLPGSLSSNPETRQLPAQRTSHHHLPPRMSLRQNVSPLTPEPIPAKSYAMSN